MAMRMHSTISSPLSLKGHSAVAVAAEAVTVASHQTALNCRSSIQYRKLPVFSKRGLVGGDRSWITTAGKSSISSSVAGRAARGATGAVESAAATEISKSGDSYFVTDTRPVILFDGVCNMCNRSVNFMLDNDIEGKLRFAALQSEAGRALLVKSGLAPDYMSSVVLVDKDRFFIKSEAILRIGQFLNFPYSPGASFGLILPLFFRDAVYDQVAANRYKVFGKSNACRLSDSRFAERFIE